MRPRHPHSVRVAVAPGRVPLARVTPARATLARATLARATLAVAVAVGLAGCAAGTADDGAAAGNGTSPASSSPAATAAYPVTVDNCGTEVTLEAAPERIVTIKSSTTEMVLALGLGEHLVGTAFPDGPLPEGLADAPGAGAPVLADRAPSSEVVLEAEPDLVYAGWESNFSADAAGERETLQNLGIATYVSPAACKDPAYQPDPLTFDDVFAEISEAGQVLGAPAAAAALVAEQAAALAAIEPSTQGLTALWYSSGSETPYVGAGIGAPQMIMESAGLTNIAADVHDTWTSLSWEAVADRNPDVIVLVDSAWNTAEHKKEVLAANPTTAALPAVQNQRYVVVPFPASEAGVRNVDAVASVVEQLAALPAG